jgi:acyl-CoA thioesterase I
MISASRTTVAILAAITTLTIDSAIASPALTTTGLPPTCNAPVKMIRLDQALGRSASRIAQGQPLKIVAFGSSSTAGFGASSPSRSYPSRLEHELRSLLPGQEIVVINRGAGGEDAEEMLDRLQRSVLAERPDLVIWQLGTNALLGDVPLATEGALVRKGIKRLLKANIDVVLMDIQYAPMVIQKSKAAHLVRLLGRIGREAHVGVFRRYAIMRHWMRDQQLPFGTFVTDDGLHMNDWGCDCTARLLANAIVGTVTHRASILAPIPAGVTGQLAAQP